VNKQTTFIVRKEGRVKEFLFFPLFSSYLKIPYLQIPPKVTNAVKYKTLMTKYYAVGHVDELTSTKIFTLTVSVKMDMPRR
jgi:hypothetical protein